MQHLGLVGAQSLNPTIQDIHISYHYAWQSHTKPRSNPVKDQGEGMQGNYPPHPKQFSTLSLKLGIDEKMTIYDRFPSPKMDQIVVSEVCCEVSSEVQVMERTKW